MSSVLIGNQLTTPLPTPDGVKVTIDRQGKHVTEVYTVRPTIPLSSLPPIGTVHSSYDVPLQRITVSKEGAKHASLTLEWEPDDANNPSINILLTPPQQDVSLGVEMAPLKNISNSYLTTAEQSDKTADTDGKKTKAMYFATYTYTVFVASFSFSESSLDSNLSKTGSPPGVSGATTAKWRLSGRNIRKTGDAVQAAEVWEFRPWLA